MIEAPDLAIDLPPATAGDIAVINLESARQQSWSRFWQAPERPGIAECIVEQEQLTAQFVGDLAAFDRLGTLANQLARTNLKGRKPHSWRHRSRAQPIALRRQGQSLRKRWRAERRLDATKRLSLSLDQATGHESATG